MESNKEINNNTKEFDDCLISTPDDCIIIPNNDNDVPTKEEKEESIELLNDIKKEDELKEEYLECKKFYYRLKGFNKYDLTEDNFNYWKGNAYVGTGYRNFIQKSSKVMVCTALVNERIQINLFDNLIKKKSANFVPIKDGLLKYVKTDIAGPVLENALYLKKSKEFLEWRFKSHLFRFSFIKKYLDSEYGLNYKDFRTYKDVERYFNINI
jgi:hypothetical protein